MEIRDNIMAESVKLILVKQKNIHIEFNYVCQTKNIYILAL